MEDTKTVTFKDRRASADPRIDTLLAGYEDLKREMSENTQITKDMRDILGTFRVLGAIAKWVTGVAAAIAAIYHGTQYLQKP